MNITLTGHHLEITPAIRDHVNSKLTAVKRHFDQVINVNVILSVDKLIHKAEAKIHVRGKEVFAESTDGDMYNAIDSLVDKLDRQVLKYKEKQNNHERDTMQNHLN